MLQYSYPSHIRAIDRNYSRMWEFLFQIHSSYTRVCRETNNSNEWTLKDGYFSRLVACGVLIPVFIFRNTFVAWNIKKSVVWRLMIANTAPHFCGVNAWMNEWMDIWILHSVLYGMNFLHVENCSLLGYYAASKGNYLPTFRGIDCPETSVRNYH